MVYDHDFTSFAAGVGIPQGIYAGVNTSGYINLGMRQDSRELADDSRRNGWYNPGQYDDAQTPSLLLLWDGGGRNNRHHYLFKAAVQPVANALGMAIRIAHYRPYTSTYNPIDHRLLPPVSRVCRGVIFTSLERVQPFIEQTQTRQGLPVTVQIIHKIYQIGRQVLDDFKRNMPIVFDDFLPQWNYTALPNAEVI